MFFFFFFFLMSCLAYDVMVLTLKKESQIFPFLLKYVCTMCKCSNSRCTFDVVESEI